MSGLGQIGRPKSESHGSASGGIPLIDETGETRHGSINGSLNPFQDDSTQVWQHRNSSAVSSPEVAVDTNYSYQYKRVTAGPATPELTLRSSASSPPPTPVLIQVRSMFLLGGSV